MNVRQKLLQNISSIAPDQRLKQHNYQSNLRIRSQKSRKDNASFIVHRPQQQLKNQSTLYQTQIHSPIKTKNICNKENQPNYCYIPLKNSDELIINSAESHSLNLSYSPSSKKKPQPSCFLIPSKSIKPKSKLTKKALEIRSIYLDKPKPQPKQNNYINIKGTFQQRVIR